ncbi:hypothetical protein SRHO_G00042590 [Serrasalmus rhombeus]
MTTGLEDPQNISDARKMVVINNELLRLKVDIAALQETRLAESGSLKEKDYTFVWQGKSTEDRREHGVVRIAGAVTLISAYAPTLTSTPEAKDKFYTNVNDVIRNIHCSEHLILLGDLNARVGGDHDSWPSCLGSFGVGKINENGQRLLELCSYHGLCLTNSYFQTKPQHRVSWHHPRSKHWHQLDMVIVKRTSLKHVLLTCSYHSANCDSDHSLAIQKSALATFGRKTSKNCDWFGAKSAEFTPVIETKRAALSEYKLSPSEKTLQALISARRKVQQIGRRCNNEYWQELSHDIQNAAATGNIRGMYEGIKKALRPMQSKTAPPKTSSGKVITDKAKMERWVEHYSELCSRENIIVTSALDTIDPLPIMEELDAEPTQEELSKAIDNLACGKAPGNDGIPRDLIRHCKTTLLHIFCQCWSEGGVPQDMRDATNVTLYKNKGDRSD